MSATPESTPPARPRNPGRQGKSGLTVYLTPEQRRAFGMAAQDNRQSVSEWLISIGVKESQKFLEEK